MEKMQIKKSLKVDWFVNQELKLDFVGCGTGGGDEPPLVTIIIQEEIISGKADLNRRPLTPEASALPAALLPESIKK